MLVLLALVSFSVEYAKSEWEEVNYTPEQLQEIPGYGDSWMFMPDGYGQPRTAFLTHEEIDEMAVTARRRNRKINEDVTFDLYTRKNPNKSQEIFIDDIPTLKKTNYDFNKKTKIITHGWMSSNKSDTCQNIKNKYLKVKDYNVIIVDWAPIAKNVFYFLPMMDTKTVGGQVARLINFLVENGVQLENFHLIGHSLGAHVCGYAGNGVKNGKVERITGLDPALPGFQMFVGNSHRLDPGDAKFVDVIHTCGGALGFAKSIGTADYYPNGGTPSQPGCFGLVQFMEACSHSRAWQYFTESIGNPNAFPATQCTSWTKFKTNECKNQTSVPMGEETSYNAQGNYYLKTSPNHPYHAIPIIN